MATGIEPVLPLASTVSSKSNKVPEPTGQFGASEKHHQRCQIPVISTCLGCEDKASSVATQIQLYVTQAWICMKYKYYS